jgi:hypothetical protein
MSQVFVRKSDITLPVVPVAGHFPELPWVDRNTYGDQFTVLGLPATAIVASADVLKLPVLASNWRTYADTIINKEAERRILEAFPQYMQNNVQSANSDAIMTYGSSRASWPTDAANRWAEGERGFDYIAAIRIRSDALITALPPDPTSDVHWPARIAPVYVAPY